MEFTNRSGQTAPSPLSSSPSGRPTSARGRKPKKVWINIVSGILLISIALLVGAIAVKIAQSSGSNSGESRLIDKEKYQAVFLTGGQVYFGKISNLNNDFLTLKDIYYLRVNEQTQGSGTENQTNDNQGISLAKLGCELHRPQDLMVINRGQVSFWENLEDSGQVVVAIQNFIKENPEGQKCTQANTQQPQPQPQAAPQQEQQP